MKRAPTPEEFAAQEAIKRLPLKDMIDHVQREGFLVLKDDPRVTRQVKLHAPKIGRVRWGVVSDTHLGSNYQQLSHWQHFTQEAERWGAEFMLHCGDVVDGSQMRKGHEYEVFKHGSHAQGSYAAKAIPTLYGRDSKVALPTYIIGGNHDEDFWKAAGANVIATALVGRSDLQFLGAPAATFHISGLRIALLHPSGGVAYARSYKMQKIIEQLPADDKPHILLAGHWHIADHVPGYRNVEGFSLPCFQAQTPYLRCKGLSPVIGGVLFEAEYSKVGLESLTTKWVIYHTPIRGDYPSAR